MNTEKFIFTTSLCLGLLPTHLIISFLSTGFLQIESEIDFFGNADMSLTSVEYVGLPSLLCWEF